LGKDAHKQQAGPNGPENNFDLNYAFSDDFGETWKNSENNVLAKLGSVDPSVKSSILPSGACARVFEIPMNSGILNQEGQTTDCEGGFWVLNREKVGENERWIVYYRSPKGRFFRPIKMIIC
jgi:hypothetical protein